VEAEREKHGEKGRPQAKRTERQSSDWKDIVGKEMEKNE
jgi:hypothetical protein